MLMNMKHIEKVVFFENHLSYNPLNSTKVKFGFSAKDELPSETKLLKQVHSSLIVDADRTDVSSGLVEADGLYLSTSGTIAVRTADCLPVLLIDQNKSIAMALHGGWRGLAGGIIQNSLEVLSNHSVNLADVIVILGPCIGMEKFEVGPEVIDSFCAEGLGLTNEQLALCCSKGVKDRWHFDLTQAAISMLLNAGLSPENTSALRSCTFNNSSIWPSYRREKVLKSHIYSWITLNF